MQRSETDAATFRRRLRFTARVEPLEDQIEVDINDVIRTPPRRIDRKSQNRAAEKLRHAMNYALREKQKMARFEDFLQTGFREPYEAGPLEYETYSSQVQW